MMKKSALLFCLFLFVFDINAQKSITLDDCFTFFKFYPEYAGDFQYSPDGMHYLTSEEDGIVEYDLTSGAQTRVIVAKSALTDAGEWDEFTFNADQSKVMLRANVKPVYRHSVLADYWIYDLKTQKLTNLNEGGEIQFAAFSPSGREIAFIVHNNLYYKNLLTNEVKKITSDGAENKVRNGIPDWVYEEEFSPVTGEGMVATKWSPDGSKIAFIRFDESRIKEFTMNFYTGAMYPEQKSFKYPKVGEENSTVSVRIYDLDAQKTSTVMGLEADDYVPRIYWTNDNKLALYRLNRRQDTLEFLVTIPGRAMFDAEENTTYLPLRPLLQEYNRAYVDIHDNLTFLKDGRHFLWTSEQNGFNHVYLRDFDSADSTRQLISGNFDVTAFYGLDEKSGKFYYQTATPTPLDRQVWEGDLKGASPRLLTPGNGTWDAAFNPNFERYVLTHSDVNTPPQITLRQRDGLQLRSLVDNANAIKNRKEYGMVDKTFWTFKTPDGTELNGWMLKPQTLEPGKKYPVLFDVYGGPGSQTVQNQYDGYMDPWRQLLVKKGVIVVSVDNRGTGARGEAFKKCTQLQLGKYETEDQISAARYLGTLPYVDPGRIGIWGWSFGGYLSTSCILKGNTTFKMAMAVAPVTNWKWYDSAYTERYMHTTKDNAQGYEDNSPVNFADKLRGSNYLICHGVADDNVHWQQSVEMINALIKANKQFETYYYPNRNHGIYGDHATIHLFTKLTSFIENKL